MTCPNCSESAKFVGYRSKRFVTLCGSIYVSRTYYHCKHCRQGHFPWDKTLRFSPQCLSPAAQEVTTLAGIQESFGRAAERTLLKLSGLQLSESTVERTTEGAGERLGQRLTAGEVFGPAEEWDWHLDATGKSCAYVSLDATGILMQGPNGSKVDGRMVTVGMIFNPQPRNENDEVLARPCDGARYLAGLYTLEKLGEQLRQQAAQVGMEHAEQWIALSDGGSGLENFFDVYFPRAVKILDFHHVTGYLAGLAKVLRPGAEGETLLATWCHRLKHEGGRVILSVLESLDRRRMTMAARAEHDKVQTYFNNHVEKMDYPEYRRRGWQIGTGAVESGCKTVINQRLCMGGMRWGEDGSDAVAHLRALYRSDPNQWDAFWSTTASA